MSQPPNKPHPLEESFNEMKRFIEVFTAGVDRYPLGDRATFVVEVRALKIPNGKYRPRNLCGFFDLTDWRPLWKAVRPLLEKPPGEQPEGVYLTINPVDPEFLGLANNCFKEGLSGAADHHIQTRNFIFTDADPVKKLVHASATDEEKAAAFDLHTRVRAELASLGFEHPMVIDSGNGYHGWYRVNLPADDGGVVERLLKGLAAKFDTPAAKVDTKVFNPSRICKLPGTYARKGDSIPTRPHRMARVLEVPPC